MTLTQAVQERPLAQLEPQYIYGSHPDALGAKHTLRVFVDVPNLEHIVDLVMPSDGRPLGRRIQQWCTTEYEAEYREWWTPEPVNEF